MLFILLSTRFSSFFSFSSFSRFPPRTNFLNFTIVVLGLTFIADNEGIINALSYYRVFSYCVFYRVLSYCVFYRLLSYFVLSYFVFSYFVFLLLRALLLRALLLRALLLRRLPPPREPPGDLSCVILQSIERIVYLLRFPPVPRLVRRLHRLPPVLL